MRNLKNWIAMSALVVGAMACQSEDSEPGDSVGSGAGPNARRRLIEQIPPPMDLKEPPADATKTASGLIYKKLAANDGGAQARGKDTTLIHYTGWRQSTGDTFFTTKARGQPISIDVAHAAPGFTEALQLLHKGEKAVLWVPPSPGTAETLVYEVEVVDVVEATAAKPRREPSPRPPG